VRVDGEPWAERGTYDWVHEDGRADLVRTDRDYDLRFRTFPAPDARRRCGSRCWATTGSASAPPTARASDSCASPARSTAPCRAAGVRLVLTTGDNVYIGEEDSVDGTGDEDDDWYYSFYQPYRYVIAQVPVYPGVGNHDTGESEISDNRDQLADNFFTDLRFGDDVETRRASVDPGLYYRFSYGADIEFVCIDTTEAEEVDGYRYFFDIPRHRAFLEESFPAGEEPAPPGGSRSPTTPRTARARSTTTCSPWRTCWSRCSIAPGCSWSSAATSTTSSTITATASTT
jgi:tartrate-resistant acid phosphatase type 5